MEKATDRPGSLRDILFLPLGCLLSLRPMVVFGLLIGVAFFGGYFYYFVNVDLFGIGAPHFDELTISPDFRRISQVDGSYLTVTYENNQDSFFTGLIRHISPIRLGDYPVLTHDILVTSGDFADPGKVNTSVFNHHFSWTSADVHPDGTINLLHAVPVNEGLYQQLLSLQNGQTVRIKGREILRIEAFSPQGGSKGWWQDEGCNTLVVTSVDILPGP